MKKRGVCLFLFLFLVPSILASDAWHLDSQKVFVHFSMSEELDIIPLSDSYQLDYINTRLSFIPKDGLQQRVTDLDTRPKADIKDDVLFSWLDVQTDSVRYQLTADIELDDARLTVKDKISFPIRSIPDDVKPYLEPSETIDITEDMALLASSIIEGEDDLFIVVSRIGDWVETNVEYDLATSAADASMKSSWVLENRYGVCDELTSLFISLLRSVGIPARFVSGIAYTNSPQFDTDWGPHGWAEVYFPDVGWIPYDVTYDEFGFTDPTHIKLKESLDSGEPSATYEWRGHNVDIEPQATGFDVRLRSHEGDQPDRIAIEAYPYEGMVGFGSYQLIIAEVTNLMDYYVTETLYISSAEVLTGIDQKTRVDLRPQETRKFFFIVRSDEDLDRNYEYNVPITVYTQYGLESQTSLTLRDGKALFSLEDIKDIRSSMQDTDRKNYQRDVSLFCTSDVKLLVDSPSDIRCIVKNIGNQILEDVAACYDHQCEAFDLMISQEKGLVYKVIFGYPGENILLITVKNDDFSKAFKKTVEVFDEASFDVRIDAPASVSYDDLFEVDVLLNRTSLSIPRYLSVTLEAGRYEETVDIEELDGSARYIFKVQGKQLSAGENEIILKVAYSDEEWKEVIEKDYISLDNLTFFQKLILRIKGILG